jgi:ribosomal protein S18 acetylase RimI-like enzyme
MTIKARLVKKEELNSLLSLYKYLIPDDIELEIDKEVEEHWNEILSDPNLFYIVIEEDGKIVSSCTLAVIKNLTRSARPYGLIENVVTHPDYRNKGYGTTVLNKAVEICQYKGCYKVMLMTSSKNESILGFYENAGFDKGEKTGFIKRIQ